MFFPRIEKKKEEAIVQRKLSLATCLMVALRVGVSPTHSCLGFVCYGRTSFIIEHVFPANCKNLKPVLGACGLELDVRKRDLLHDGSIRTFDVLDDLAVAIDLRVNKVDEVFHGESFCFVGLVLIIRHEKSANCREKDRLG